MKQNDAFNLSWKIRKVNENTQSSFRIFSEGSFGEKSFSLPSAVLLKTGGTRGPSWGRPCTEAMVLREVEETRQIAKKEVCFSFRCIRYNMMYRGESERLCSNPCSHLTDRWPWGITYHRVSPLSHLQTRVTQRLASKCDGSVKSTMSYVALRPYLPSSHGLCWSGCSPLCT